MEELVIINEPRPSRADAVKNRELLLVTAAQLAAERGMDAVSMSDIAEAAGVGKGTLYRHFRSKTEVCHALLDEDQRDLQQRTLLRLRENGDQVDNLRWFLGEVLSFVWRNLSLLNVKEAGGDRVTLAHPAHFWWRQTIQALLNQVQPVGDIEYVSDVLYVMLAPQTILFQRETLGYDQPRLHDGIIATLLKLLA